MDEKGHCDQTIAHQFGETLPQETVAQPENFQ